MNHLVMPLYTKHGKEVKMPNVTNLPFEEAEKILKDNGFRPILDHEVFSTLVPHGHVIAQNPLADAIVKTNRRTYLTVSKGEEAIRIPRLIGGSERDAVLQLRQLGLVPGERFYETSSFYPKGVVSDQSIPAGDSASVGDTVHIQISSGDPDDELVVPNLIGKSFEEAKKILLENGFKLGMITYQVNSDLLPDTIIQQSLPSDSTVSVGTEVDLILSQIENSNEDP
jgi:serine/threonine-protein kinase